VPPPRTPSPRPAAPVAEPSQAAAAPRLSAASPPAAEAVAAAPPWAGAGGRDGGATPSRGVRGDHHQLGRTPVTTTTTGGGAAGGNRPIRSITPPRTASAAAAAAGAQADPDLGSRRSVTPPRPATARLRAPPQMHEAPRPESRATGQVKGLVVARTNSPSLLDSLSPEATLEETSALLASLPPGTKFEL
jgi:hypothetical protein